MENERDTMLDRVIPVFTRAIEPQKTVKLVLWSSSPKERIILKLAESLNPLGAMILYMNIQQSGKANEFIWIIVLKFNTTQGEFQEALEKLLQSMKENGEVSMYYYKFPLSNGYFIDHNIFSLVDPAGRRVAIFSYDNLIGLFVVPRKEYGNASGAFIVQKIGEMYGKTIARELRQDCYSFGVKTCLEMLHAQGESKGFLHQKSIEVFKDEEGVALRVLLDRLIEEEILMENDIRECGAHQKGVYLGFFSEILGESMSEDRIEEIRCISKGDPFSVFLIKLPRNIKI
ncbi:MAG: hypothetical protein C0179_00760 [Fervidicoccus sp.]|nr:MAG: hypothetical protein C0179_00760 [Fervidicoccus sp.]